MSFSSEGASEWRAEENISILLAQYSGDQVKEDERGRTRNTHGSNDKCAKKPWLMVLKMFIIILTFTVVIPAVYESVILLRITPWSISLSHASSMYGDSSGLDPATLCSVSFLCYLALASGKFRCSGDSPCPFAEVVSGWVLERWLCRQDGANSDGRQPVPSPTTTWEECRISIPFPLDGVHLSREMFVS